MNETNEWKLINEVSCDTCNGKGNVTEARSMGILEKTCPKCRGIGVGYKLYMGTPIKNNTKDTKSIG